METRPLLTTYAHREEQACIGGIVLSRRRYPRLPCPTYAAAKSRYQCLSALPRHPQTNGICERFRKTILDEFYSVAFRKKAYTSIEALQADVDEWLKHYNEERPHSGRYCYGKTPVQTFKEAKHLADEKMLDRVMPFWLESKVEISDRQPAAVAIVG